MRKIYLYLLTGVLILSAFSGCTSGHSDADAPPAATQPAPTGSDTAPEDSSEPAEVGYPLDTDVTIKIWSPYIPLQKNYLSQEDSPFHAGLNENTGLDVRWEWPAPGADGNQAYNTMLASQDLPDIIYVWDNFNEGPKLLDDGIIITLDDVLPDYAPNYWNYLQNNPAVDRAVKTDDGNYFTFQSLREDPWLCTYTGPVVRKDWLDEQGLEVPSTIDEWDNVIRVFKEKYNAQIIPVDSEHSAIFQCIDDHDEYVKNIILTASGGPFRGKNKEQLKNVTCEDAVNIIFFTNSS